MVRRTVIQLTCFGLVLWTTIYIFSAIRTQRMDLRSNLERTCTSIDHVMFLKTHKTGGSTVQSILMRYGISRDLNFVLPPESNYLGYKGTGSEFNRSFVDARLRRVGRFDILCHHARFNAPEMASVMKRDSMYVTILRRPTELFESLFHYSYFDYIYNTTLEDFLSDYRKMKLYGGDRLYFHLGFNQSLFDLGFNSVGSTTTEQLDDAIDIIARKFDLVMITELFDESLILLKNKMCWRTEDIVNFKQNVRSESSKRRPSSKVVDRLAELNSGDFVLYRFFESKLLGMIDEFGAERMRNELTELNRLNDRWSNRCVQDRKMNRFMADESRRGYHYDAIGYEIKRGQRNNDMCNYLTLPELQFTDLLRERQLERINSSSQRCKWNDCVTTPRS
ncbi:GAL3ST1 (predicted) [Pycnogonum litorale]